jgi:hypothetical protein
MKGVAMRIWLTLPALLAAAPMLLGQQPGTIVPSGGAGAPNLAPAKDAVGTPFLVPVKDGAAAPVQAPGKDGTGGIATAPTAAAPTPGMDKRELMRFDPLQAQLNWREGHWEVQAGQVCVRDFGNREHDAEDALNVIRRLNLTQRGTVGHPLPIMEYWLSEGQAPHLLGGGLHLFPIDRASLRVESIQGQWCVLDNRRLLFNFGPLEQDARQALDVIRSHSFDQIGYVGAPQPTMIYFVGGRPGLTPMTVHPTSGIPKSDSLSVRPVPTEDDKSPKKEQPLSPLLVQQAQLLGRGVYQLAPAPGPGVTNLRFDPHAVGVRREGSSWKVTAGPHVLADFGSDERQARTALQLLQFYNCSEQHLIGVPTPTCSYFLTNGHAPMGGNHNLQGRLFEPDKINTREYQNNWYVCEGNKPLLFFGDHKADAQELTTAIKRYRFDCISQFGTSGQAGMTLLVRTR